MVTIRHKTASQQGMMPRGPNGGRLCRYCAIEVKKPRRTFCSDQCLHHWNVRSNAAYARRCVHARDRGVCAICHFGAGEMDEALHRLRYVTNDRMERDRLETKLASMGFNIRQTLWDMDHIKPVSDGGGTCGLENLRTLCQVCHKRETAKLAAKRAERKRADKNK